MNMTDRFLSKRPINSQAGQSIVEILVAVMVMSLVLTAVASMLTLTVKNTAESRAKVIATQKAQSAIEVYRRERKVLGWADFYQSVGEGVFCLNALPTNSTEFKSLTNGECEEGVAEAGTEFTRQVRVSFPGVDVVRVEATVGWLDGDRPRSVVVTQELKNAL